MFFNRLKHLMYNKRKQNKVFVPLRGLCFLIIYGGFTNENVYKKVFVPLRGLCFLILCVMFYIYKSIVRVFVPLRGLCFLIRLEHLISLARTLELSFRPLTGLMFFNEFEKKAQAIVESWNVFVPLRGLCFLILSAVSAILTRFIY